MDKIKLKSGREIGIKDISLDERDEMLDRVEYTYDDKTEDMFEVFNGQATGASKGITLLNNDATLSDTIFGINMPASVLTSVSFNEGDVMMLDLSFKAVGSGVASSTALVEVAC